jgi:predicted dehydrogenase
MIVEAYAYRAHPHMRKIKEIISSGQLGKIKMVHGSFSFVMTKADDIRWDPAMGGGALWDIGCYPLSFARTILGTEPLEAFGWQVTSPSGIDEVFAGQLRFPGDIYFQVDCSFKIPSHEFMEIIGDEGTLNIPLPFNNSAIKNLYLVCDGKTSTIVVKGPNPYLAEVENFADAILLGKPPASTLADSRFNTAAILALLESAKTGQPIKL